MIRYQEVDHLREQQDSYRIDESPDYKIFQKYKKDSQKLTYEFYKKYMPLIKSKSYRYEVNSKGKIDRDDFCSETYLEFHKMVLQLKEEKMNPERFMFHRYAIYAIGKALKKFVKIANVEINYIEECDMKDESTRTQSSVFIDTLKFSCRDETENILNKIVLKDLYKKMTPRQKVVVKNWKKGKTLMEIKDIVGCSYGTVNGEIYRTNKMIKEFFY